MPYDYDLLILGSGSTAFAAALAAQAMGKTAVMTEARTVGGTCVNRGCLPSKNLIEAAKLLHEARHPRYPGLQPGQMTLDFAALVAQKRDLMQAYRQQKYANLIGGAIHIEAGHARFVDPHTVDIAGKRLSGEKVLIATGSRPVVPEIDGLDQVPSLTSDLLTTDEPSELTQLPASMLIIGGGYIGLELGQMFQRFGTDVTLFDRNDHVLAHGYEPEVGRTIGRILTDEGLRVVTHATVRAVRQAHEGVVATVTVGGSERQYQAERVLVATGRRPNTDQIGLETAGVAVNGGGEIDVNASLQTNVAHIFAAGDVIGRQAGSQMATPVGSQDGGIAARNALGEARRSVDHRVIPRVIFTDPQVAVVGMTEADAIAAGHPCWCNTLPMSLVPRAGAIRDTRGMIKMVADNDTHEVLGVSMVGPSAGEVIHEAAMALHFRATVQDFIDLIHVYPTMAEALKIVAISRYKDPARLSCCAE